LNSLAFTLQVLGSTPITFGSSTLVNNSSATTFAIGLDKNNTVNLTVQSNTFSTFGSTKIYDGSTLIFDGSVASIGSTISLINQIAIDATHSDIVFDSNNAATCTLEPNTLR